MAYLSEKGPPTILPDTGSGCVSAVVGAGSMEGCWGGSGAVWCESGAKNVIPETKNIQPHKNRKSKDDFFHPKLRFSLEKQYRQWIQGVATTQCWNFKQSLGAIGGRVGIGLSYRPARLYSLAELVPWNRFLDSLKVKKFGLWMRGEGA